MRNRGEHLTGLVKVLVAVVTAAVTMGATFNFVFVRVSPAPESAVPGVSRRLPVPEVVWEKLFVVIAAAADREYPPGLTLPPPWRAERVQADGLAGFLVMLDESYSWSFESSTTLSFGDTTGSQKLTEREVASLMALIRPVLQRATHVVALGMSSCSNYAQNLEEERANLRGNRLETWLEETLGGASEARKVSRINLGVHAGPCGGDDDRNRRQRRIALLALSGGGGEPSERSLRDLMGQGPWAGFDPRLYSRSARP